MADDDRGVVPQGGSGGKGDHLTHLAVRARHRDHTLDAAGPDAVLNDSHLRKLN